MLRGNPLVEGILVTEANCDFETNEIRSVCFQPIFLPQMDVVCDESVVRSL